MEDFSIDISAEKIADPRTKEYFSEVMSSYMNGNYRSSIVMLWSVAICDLVYKLQSLSDLYGDQTATTILDEIQKRQQRNQNAPEWESWLVEEINNRKLFFEPADHQSLLYLQKIRHLSAHPVLSGTNFLFSPSKESVRALIRSTMEGVLLKPPVFSKKIVGEFAKDLADKKHLLPDDKALSSYLNAKYFKHLNKSVEEELTKALWKFCFRIKNQDTLINLEINVRCLKLLFLRNQIAFRGIVERNVAHFSEISSEPSQLTALSEFFESASSIYFLLSDAAKTIYATFAKANPHILASSSYISPNYATHIREISALPYIDKKKLDYQKLISACQDDQERQSIYQIAASVYCDSRSYNSADSNFQTHVSPFVSKYSKETVDIILQGIEVNNQTYGRGRSQTDHSLIRDRATELDMTDLSAYTNFLRDFKEE